MSPSWGHADRAPGAKPEVHEASNCDSQRGQVKSRARELDEVSTSAFQALNESFKLTYDAVANMKSADPQLSRRTPCNYRTMAGDEMTRIQQKSSLAPSWESEFRSGRRSTGGLSRFISPPD